MKTKYVFLDIDGTLVDNDASIPESAAEAIRKARKNGHKVFICSGRSKCEMHDSILKAELDGIVGASGAYIELDGEVIYSRPMTPQMNKRLFDYLLPKKVALYVETTDEYITNDVGYAYVNEYINWCIDNNVSYDKALFEMLKTVDNLEDYYELPINKMLYMSKDIPIEQVKDDLSDEFTVVGSGIDFPCHCGELSEFGINKGKGIEYLIDYFNADMSDTIGIGDGENDVEMLKACAVGIAMGNAKQLLKDMADYVTTDVDKDGLKNAFKHYGLI